MASITVTNTTRDNVYVDVILSNIFIEEYYQGMVFTKDIDYFTEGSSDYADDFIQASDDDNIIGLFFPSEVGPYSSFNVILPENDPSVTGNLYAGEYHMIYAWILAPNDRVYRVGMDMAAMEEPLSGEGPISNASIDGNNSSPDNNLKIDWTLEISGDGHAQLAYGSTNFIGEGPVELTGLSSYNFDLLSDDLIDGQTYGMYVGAVTGFQGYAFQFEYYSGVRNMSMGVDVYGVNKALEVLVGANSLKGFTSKILIKDNSTNQILYSNNYSNNILHQTGLTTEANKSYLVTTYFKSNIDGSAQTLSQTYNTGSVGYIDNWSGEDEIGKSDYNLTDLEEYHGNNFMERLNEVRQSLGYNVINYTIAEDKGLIDDVLFDQAIEGIEEMSPSVSLYPDYIDSNGVSKINRGVVIGKQIFISLENSLNSLI